MEREDVGKLAVQPSKKVETSLYSLAVDMYAAGTPPEMVELTLLTFVRSRRVYVKHHGKEKRLVLVA